MTRRFIHKIPTVALLMSLAMMLAGCSETIEEFFSAGFSEHEEVLFTTALPSAAVTRSSQEEYNQQMAAYKAEGDKYEFTVEMYAAGDNAASDKLKGSSTYRPVEDDNTIGTLTAKTGATPLYWDNLSTPYAFKATAGTETLADDQSTKASWLLQDRLVGYGYIQKWNVDKSAPVDQLDALNYHTAKEWRNLNKETKLVENDEDYKKIPLYLQHQRSLITVILKAGEGVSREALAFDVAKKDLSAAFYSYTEDQQKTVSSQTITPLASELLIDYDADKNGAARNDVSTTRYDAIVEPYNYADGDKATTDPIVRISLSGQKYSFYAGSDTHFDTNKDSYNLTAGHHLTLTVVLSRDSRKVQMSAQIEDWTEEVTNTICDDYGNAGEPIKIKNRDELIDFLKDDTKNKAGNIALITADINLEETSTKYTGNWGVYNGNDLNCTLSLGGMTLLGNHRFVRQLGSAASLQNGTIQIGGTVDAAIATTNSGTIDDVRITTEYGTYAYATIAGAVIDNKGTLSRCHSSLRVQGDDTTPFVGGIAATSLSSSTMSAAIDACTVTGSVKGGLQGGGIVGKASGYVTNNTFDYGMTLAQNKATHKNIVAERDNAHSLTAENNAWPTTDDNLGLENATAAERRYDGIISDEAELQASVATTTYNQAGRRYRLAQSITVSRQVGDMAYELDGNNQQMATSAMIFRAITGRVHHLTVFVTESMATTPDVTDATDAIAPLAFEVTGEQAAVEHVKVRMADGTEIKASNPAGLVVWVYGGATVSGCEAKVNLFADVETNITQGRKFAGGLVSTVSRGTVTQCILHSGSIFRGTSSAIIHYGGIVGGIELKEGWHETPQLTITDCTNFVKMAREARRGAILGNALQGAALATSDCQGNWWDADAPAVGFCDGYSAEQAIGRRNAVTPAEHEF